MPQQQQSDDSIREEKRDGRVHSFQWRPGWRAKKRGNDIFEFLSSIFIRVSCIASSGNSTCEHPLYDA
jgi:hypothetical protein